MRQDIDGSIHRIISGYYNIYVNEVKYKIVSPTLEIKHRASLIYEAVINEYKYSTDIWLPDNQIQMLLLVNNLWDNNKQKILDDQYKLLDNTKIDLFLNYINDKKRNKAKILIQEILTDIHKLNEQKSYFDFLNLNNYAQSIQNQFMILNMVYKNDKLLFDSDIGQVDTSLMSNIIQEIQDNIIDMDTMKNIVKSDKWRNYWNAGKEKVIGDLSLSWTEEQLTIINLSKTYDSIREHPEAPTEQIMQDNDALDGWMLYQNQKIEKDKKKQQLEDKFGLKNKNGQEVFIVTDSVEETREIFDLNDPESKEKIKQIKQLSQQNKEIKWADVPFVKQELQQQTATQNRKG